MGAAVMGRLAERDDRAIVVRLAFISKAAIVDHHGGSSS